MRKKSKFYGIYGWNAYGVCGDYDRVLNSKQYIPRGFKVKRFDTFGEAEEFAYDGFCDYAYAKTPFPDITIPEKLKLNQIVFPYKAKK